MKVFRLLTLALLGLLFVAGTAQAAVQEWEVLSLKGIAGIEPLKVASHNLDTLDGKNIVLRWNAKHNGDNFLNRVAELLTERFPKANIIKAWEVEPLTYVDVIQRTHMGPETTSKVAELIKAMKPDIVISAQAD